MPTAAETISGNESLLTELLLRLPPRSLLRLKLVSKRWLDIISSPLFVLLHSRHHRRRTPFSGLFLHRWSNSDLQFISLIDRNHDRDPPSVILPRGIRILQSCNGFLLSSNEIGDGNEYFVLNPTTGRRSAVIPPIPTDNYNSVGRNLSITFDPGHSPHYKIVAVVESRSPINRYTIMIHDSNKQRLQCWRIAVKEFEVPLDMTFFGSGVYCNGSIHWISPRGNGVRYNVEKESIGLMPPPPAVEGVRRWRQLLEAEGRLLMVDEYGAPASEIVVMEMEMEKDFGQWTVRHRVDVSVITTSYPGIARSRVDACGGMWHAYHVMCVCGGGEGKGEERMMVRIPGKVLSYWFDDKRISEIGEFGNGSDAEFDWVDVFPYVETLASP